MMMTKNGKILVERGDFVMKQGQSLKTRGKEEISINEIYIRYICND